MSRAIAGLRSASSFLTPLGGAAAPGPEGLWWFPVVGAACGFTVGGIWWLAARLWPRPVAAAIAVVVDLALTGLLHFDGLCDAADGLLGHLDSARRLEVMASPEVGAFGVTVVAASLLLRWAALSVISPDPLLLAGLWAASRTQMAVTIVGVPYARDGGGLATAFIGEHPERRVVPLAAGGLVVAMALAASWRPLGGAVSVAAGTVAAGAVVVLARRRLGGFTGDVLGAAGVVGETVGLLVAAARW